MNSSDSAGEHGTIQASPPNRAPDEVLDLAYNIVLRHLELSETHRANLIERGLTAEQIRNGGYRTANRNRQMHAARALVAELGQEASRSVPGFAESDRGPQFHAPPGMIIPVRSARGEIVALKVRVDDPGERGKYLSVSSTRRGGPGPNTRVHVPLRAQVATDHVRITEGELKADIATTLDRVRTIGLPSASNHAELIPTLRHLEARVVHLAFDADWRSNENVARSLLDVWHRLGAEGFDRVLELWNVEDAKGIDDLPRAGLSPEAATGRAAEARIRRIASQLDDHADGERTINSRSSTETSTGNTVTSDCSKTPYGLTPPASDDADDSDDGEDGKSAGIDVVLDVVANCELFTDRAGSQFILDLALGKRLPMGIGSLEFRDAVAAAVFKKFHRGLSGEALSQAERILRHDADRNGGRIELNPRVRSSQDKIEIDLADEMGRVVVVSPGGWEVTRPARLYFARHQKTMPHPVPRAGGHIEELRRFIRVQTEEDFLLVLTWMVCSLLLRGTLPILLITGEEGTAKTTTARFIRRLIDPCAVEVIGSPKDLRSFSLSVHQSHVTVIDNITSVTHELSDLVCRIATGEAQEERMLYSNSDTVCKIIKRPLIMTGIGLTNLQSDLFSRCFLIQLPPIADDERRTEIHVTNEFEKARPFMLGALLNLSASVMASLPKTASPNLRLADAGAVATCVGGHLGKGPDWVQRVFDDNEQGKVAAVVDGSPLARAVIDHLDVEGQWEGTATELVKLLRKSSSADAEPLPSLNRVKAELERVSPALRRYGIHFSTCRESSRARRRLLRLERRGPSPKNDAHRPSASSEPSDDQSAATPCPHQTTIRKGLTSRDPVVSEKAGADNPGHLTVQPIVRNADGGPAREVREVEDHGGKGGTN